MVTVYTDVEVDVELSEFDTEDLIEELESRGHMISKEGDYETDNQELLTTIWEKRRTNKDYQFELDRLIYNVLGRVI